MAGRRIGPFIIDEPEYRCSSLLMNDEEMENLGLTFSHTLTSSSSHERGVSIWNHEEVESLKSLGFKSHDNNAALLFGGIGDIEDSFKLFTREMEDIKDTSDDYVNIGASAASTSAVATSYFQVNSAAAAVSASHHQQQQSSPSCFPTFTPRQMMTAPSSSVYNPQQHQPHQQQQRAPLSITSPHSLQPIGKPPVPPKIMTAGEFHLTRFGSYRLSVSPPDSLMANIDEEDEAAAVAEEEEKVPSKN